MSTTPSKITLQLDAIKFNSNKLSISEPSVGIIANQLYKRVLDGEVSAVKTYEAVKLIGDVADVLKKCVDENGKNNFTDLVRKEISDNLQGEKAYTTEKGTKFSLAETGTKYSFKTCGDKIWEYYDFEIERLTKLKKDREAFLKTINNVVIMSFPDPVTGELLENVELTPAIKTSTSSFKVELRKE